MAAHVMLNASGTTGGAINLSIDTCVTLITNTWYTNSTKGEPQGKSLLLEPFKTTLMGTGMGDGPATFLKIEVDQNRSVF